MDGILNKQEAPKQGKILHATKARTVRELVAKAEELQIPREDVVQILQESGQYVLFYYYK